MELNNLPLVKYNGYVYIVINSFEDEYIICSLNNYILYSDPYFEFVKTKYCSEIEKNDNNIADLINRSNDVISKIRGEREANSIRRANIKKLRKQLRPGHELINNNSSINRCYYVGKYEGTNVFYYEYESNTHSWITSKTNFTLEFDSIGERLSKEETIEKIRRCSSYFYSRTLTKDKLIECITKAEW